MKKLILILLFFATYISPQGLVKFPQGGQGNASFYSVDLNGTDEYTYRTYAAADSFLNMNGYERTLLPQSTMKIAFTLAYNGRDSLNTFTSGTDTTAGALRAWSSYENGGSSIVGGKLRITTITGTGNGITWGSALTVGEVYYIKAKARLVTGASNPYFYFGCTGAVEGTYFVKEITTEEKTFEGTFLALSTGLYIYSGDGSFSGDEVIDFDDIEVREVTNSVTNGTFADSTGWSKGDALWFFNTGAAVAYTSSSTISRTATNLPSIGKRYIVTYQVSAFTSGSVTMSYGGASGTARGSAAVFADTVTAVSTAGITFTGSSFVGTLDNIHIYEIPSYFASNTTTNNHSVGWSKTDALPNSSSDTTSIKIISTAVGDSVWQNVKIASGVNTFHGISAADVTAGNKYTLELWARAKGLKSSELIVTQNNRDFSSGTIGNWIVNTDGNGTLAYDGTNPSGEKVGALTVGATAGTVTSSFLPTTTAITQLIANGTYEISADIYLPSANNHWTEIYLNAASFSGSSLYKTNANLATTNAWQRITTTFNLGTDTTGNISVRGASTITGDIIYFDNFTLKKITKPNLYVNAVGSGTKKSDTLSVIPGVFEKVVYNFQAVAPMDTIKFWLSQADTVWTDSLNLQQTFDVVQNYWVYPRSTSGIIASKTNSITSATGIGWKLSVVGGVAYYVTQGAAFADSISFGTLNQNNWNLLTVVRREDSTITFLNGVRTTKSARIKGNINNTSNFTLGGLTGGSNLFNGLIGEVQYLRFSNIYLSDYNTLTSPLTVYNAYTLGRGFTNVWSGGTPRAVIWYDWLDATSNTTLLHDLSGNGYDLNPTTPGTVTTADQSRWKR